MHPPMKSKKKHQCKTEDFSALYLLDFVLPTPPLDFVPPASPPKNGNFAISKHFSPEEDQVRKPEDEF